MHGWRIGLDPAYDVDRLGYWFGPVFGMERERAAGLGLRHKHAVQSNIHHTYAGRKVFNRTRHPAFESVLPLNMKRDGDGLPRLNRKLRGLRRYQYIGGGITEASCSGVSSFATLTTSRPPRSRALRSLLAKAALRQRRLTRGKDEYGRSLSRRNRSPACR